MQEILPIDLSLHTTNFEVNTPEYNDFRPGAFPEIDINPVEQFKLLGSALVKKDNNPIGAKFNYLQKISQKCSYQLAEVYRDYDKGGDSFPVDKYKMHSGILVCNGQAISEPAKELVKLLETDDVNHFLQKYFHAKYNCNIPKGIDFKIYSAQFNKMGDFYTVGNSSKYNYIGLHEHKKVFAKQKTFCPLTTVLVIKQNMEYGDENNFHVVQAKFDDSTLEFSIPTKPGDLIINDWETMHRVPKLKNCETIRVTLAIQWELDF